MKNFGLLKSKILSKLTESYSKQNKKEVKDINVFILQSLMEYLKKMVFGDYLIMGIMG
jgi:hypothetical protein